MARPVAATGSLSGLTRVVLRHDDADDAREVSKPSHLIAKRAPSPASSRLGQKAVALGRYVGVHRAQDHA